MQEENRIIVKLLKEMPDFLKELEKIPGENTPGKRQFYLKKLNFK